ncbi:MAG: hypothetical protein QOI38_2475 [Sphingomonadales bacterium]|nr:hypothetical protein [Sphingomonadales bacterium]
MIRAARLFALAVLAVSPASAAVPEDAPAYSLVAGRQTRFQGRADLYCLTHRDGTRWCPEYASAWLDHARTLAGPPIGESFDAATERGPAFYRPVLVVLLRLPDGFARIVAQTEAGADGRACVAADEMDRIGWHPSGPDILVSSRGVCADLSALAAIPAPPPVTVVEHDGDLRRALRRERRRSRPR